MEALGVYLVGVFIMYVVLGVFHEEPRSPEVFIPALVWFLTVPFLVVAVPMRYIVIDGAEKVVQLIKNRLDEYNQH